MICRLCLNTLDEQNAVLLFGTGPGAGATAIDNDSSTTTNDNNGTGTNSTNNNNNNNVNGNKTTPESYLVQLISIHLYLCLSRDDAISTSICAECCSQLESFHNFWKLVELKQTTLCSQFLEIDCDVNWSEEGGEEADAEVEVEAEAEVEADVETEDLVSIVKVEPHEFNEAVYISRVDTSAKKFPCMFCEKSFKMRRYLEEHIATHTGDRPIACPYCEMAFRCRSNMYTHVKSKHTAQWLKARAERDAAKSQQATPTQQPPPPRPQPQPQVTAVHIKTEPHDETSSPPAPLPPPPPAPATLPAPQPQQNQNEPMEAINLSLSKTKSRPQPITRSISRRKTHSPKKVQSTVECSDEASSDSNPDEQMNNLLPQKRFKENELMLANYNAVAAAVVAAATLNTNTNNSSSSSSNRTNCSNAAATAAAAAAVAASAADSLQQRLCASLIQQHQQDLFHAMTTAANSMAAAAATSNYQHPPNSSNAITSIERSSSHANRLHKKHIVSTQSATSAILATPSPTSIFTSSICANCGELPGQNHRCLTKAKYACDVCGKCFKMKRYLEEHFATHTGVKLHTCAFCPTEFRSKSNMYHHTKRKHKVEWERSRATRNAAKTNAQDQQTQSNQTATV